MCTEIQMVFISALTGNVIQWLCIFFHSCLKVNIVHHYSQVSYLHVHPLSKMYFNPQVALHCIFKLFPEVCKAARKLSCPTLLLPVEVEQGGCLFVSAACFTFGDQEKMETVGGSAVQEAFVLGPVGGVRISTWSLINWTASGEQLNTCEYALFFC